MEQLLDKLNPNQQKAVMFGNGPLLILAGAGSGKTKVLTHRAAYLSQNGYSPRNIALLTFTNKAAGEMKERVAKLLTGNEPLGFAGTFHTFCAKILREHGVAVGVMPNFVIYDNEDSEDVIKNIIKDFGWDIKEQKPGMYLGVIGKMKNDLVSIDEIAKQDYFHSQVAKVWREYQTRLRKNNALDFDDLLYRTVQLLSQENIRNEISSRYKYIMVDEYQDTNKAQFEITRLLAVDGNLTVVGDASQAIYSFRGADFRNLSLLKETYPNLTTIDLPINYRSTQKILDAAYGVIKNNDGHPVIKLDSSTEENGEDITMIEATDEKDEASQIVKRAKRLTEEGEECAILYRTNAQSRAFEDELMKKGVGYKLVGGLRFYQRAEIKDLLAYLRLVINKEDEVSSRRVEKIGKRRREKFENLIEGKESELQKINPAELLEMIIHSVGYLDLYDERDENEVAKIENINELLAVAGEYNNLESFLEAAALSESDEKKIAKNAKITLMTIHAAKGLEFDNVFVVGLEEGIFPHSRTLFNKDEVEEERRLMYVALTRARKRLYLSFANSRLVFGGRSSNFPSRFISEIPGKLLKSDKKREIEASKTTRTDLFDEFGEKKRIIVPDWEVQAETKNDFDEIDNW